VIDDVPANPSNDNAVTTTHVQPIPVIPAGPSNENASSPKSVQPNGHEGGALGGHQHESTAASSNNAPANESHSGQSQGPQRTIVLEAGKETVAQANPNINPNPS
jgi:hypothetical protein